MCGGRLTLAVVLLASCGPGATAPDAAAPDTPPDSAVADAPDAAIDAAIDAPPCAPDPAGERCNGADDDCDETVDEGYPALGMTCTTGVGFCARSGTMVCTADQLGTVCNAETVTGRAEQCNSIDDDCDGALNNGDPGGGATCDSGMSGICRAGSTHCMDDGAGGYAVRCVPDTAARTETCDGIDEDCDSMIDEGLNTGTQCDGGDADLCMEGVTVCNGAGGLTCSDTTSSSTELCNRTDDDCDARTDEDWNFQTDDNNCGSCGTVCEDAGASNSCSTGTCNPICTSGRFTCDGNLANGCEANRDTNPASCSPLALGTIRGDAGTDVINRSGFDEAVFSYFMPEDNADSVYLSSQIVLQSPPGVDFDLCMRCTGCSDTREQCATSGRAGQSDTVWVYTDDDFGSEDGHDVHLRVIYASGSVNRTSCNNWSLAIYGNVSVSGTPYYNCDI